VVVASPEYLSHYGRPRTPADLARHNCLSFGPQGNQSRGWLFRIDGQVVAQRVTGDLECSDGSVLHEWTLAGCGLAWRSMWEIEQDLQQGRLLTVLDEYAAPPNGIYAILPERKHMPLRVRAFVDWLRRAYAREGYWQGS